MRPHAVGLIEFYLYIVFCVFWSGAPLGTAILDEHDTSMSAEVRGALTRLHLSMSGTSSDEGAQEVMAETRKTCASVALDRLRAPLEAKPLMALRETVVGMESLRLVAEMVRSHATELCASAGESGQKQLSLFVEGTLVQVPSICALIYRRMAGSIINLEPVVASIRNRSWVLKEIGTQHNAYVEQLLDLLQQLNSSIQQAAVPKQVPQMQ